MVNDCFELIGDTLFSLFSFSLPAVSLTFGGLIVFIFGMPILVKAFRKLMG